MQVIQGAPKSYSEPDHKYVFSDMSDLWNAAVQPGPTEAVDSCKHCHTGSQQEERKYFLEQFLTLLLRIIKKKKSALFPIHRTSQCTKSMHLGIYTIYKVRFHFIPVVVNATVVQAQPKWPSRKQKQCQTEMLFLGKVSTFMGENGLSRLCHLQLQERTAVMRLCFPLFKQLF